MSPLLEVRSLSVSYGTGWVLRDVSLAVEAGDVVGLVGESGCGKTTLGWAVLGLLPEYARTTGEIVFEGTRLDALDRRRHRALLGDRLAMIPQAAMTALDPMYTVGDQLAEVFRTHRQLSRAGAQQMAVHWLREVGLAAPESRLGAYPHELSGGMRQRIAIGAALALEPSLLIADEPTSALDVTIQAQVLDLLRRLIHEHAGAVIFITHDLGVVAQICNRVAVMYAGEIVEEAPAEVLFSEPRHPYTQSLLAAHPASGRRGERLTTLAGSVPDPASRPQGCAFRPRCPVAIDSCLDAPPWVAVGDSERVRCVHHASR